MSLVIPENQLPASLNPQEAVEAAYAAEMAEVAGHLIRGLPSLIECDKELAPYLFVNLRARLRDHNLRCIYLDGRPREADAQGGPVPVGLIGTMISQLREAVRGAVERRVVVLPHLDLLTTSQGGLTGEAREVIPLLYENPELVWLGFKDPSFPLPKVIENLFPHRLSILGTSRNRLRHLITQKEARKFGRQFNPWQLYKYVSGVNAVRLRRLLSTMEGEDYPADPKQAYRQLRQATLTGTLEIPDIDLERDIGGYTKVKKRLREEILDVLQTRDRATEAEEITRLEELIPRGMIFWGPPGTGKTYFAKAIATAIGAAVTIVSGPELKSKWVGESEENLRQIFHKARQSAPSIIVFDELDSFATARGTYTGSGVEHSMVNQLLTEMDGFHKDELVFVVGTTNFVEALDPALLRPGRFEFHLHIPYPEPDDRRAILKIYDKKMKLQMTDDALEYAVKRTNDYVVGQAGGTRYSGDHLNALARSIARLRLRDKTTGPTPPELVERALTEWVDRPTMTKKEEWVLATHEAGHAVAALFCDHSPAIERITIASEMKWAFGYVKYADPAHKYILTVNYYLDMMVVALGAREAERLLLDDISLGATADLESATAIARELVEVHGMAGGKNGVVQFTDTNRRDGSTGRRPHLAQETLKSLDERVAELVEAQRVRAETILRDNKALVETLRDMLLEKKTIDSKTIAQLGPGAKNEAKKPLKMFPEGGTAPA
ncbi:AAA family ATPase [Fimbriiglobus ruber]|uniref:Cell division protein FtsH n=1 Tax=Fimbriiglobus ruber TaxID=1908690 RepID=A0A225D8Z4_9BACT|nr:AAA family ATPase [Fimbriiglobus ruber]OWK38080.1 Cell division protein FtsH [Fimbriiglobus ruber]